MKIRLWRTLKIVLGFLFILLCIFRVIIHSSRPLRDSSPSSSPHNDTAVEELTLHNNEEVIRYMATFLDVKYDVGSNGEAPEMWLTNTGRASIKGGNWYIYYNHYTEYEKYHFPERDRPTTAPVVDHGLYIFNVNGYLYRIQPNDEEFVPIKPGEKRVIHLSIHNRRSSFHLMCPNWYVTADNVTGSDETTRVISSTVGGDLKFVGNFKISKHDKRMTGDKVAKERYMKNKENICFVDVTKVHVIPSPEHMTIHSEKTIHIDRKRWIINTLSEFIEEARFLSDKLGISISRETVNNNSIIITRPNDDDFGAEEYKLIVERDKSFVTIVASHKPGAFYGVQTLLSLISKSGNGHYIVPDCEITDKPRFKYRGLHLDVVRNFIPKQAVIRLLDVMAMYKLNKFHFHLSDDEGWRLQIPGLPELTQLTSKRCHDLSGKRCLIPQHGSGPFSSSGFGSGYYTVNDYREILTFAKSRHITVIPEFDLPGHARAAIKAMEFREKHNKGNSSFLLSEAEDQSRYKSVQNYNDSVINVCLKSVYRFARHLFRELETIHNNTQPLSFYHVGCDEIPKGVWTSSPACKRLAKSENIRDLKLYFIKSLLEMFKQKSIDIGFWEDGLFQNKTNPYQMDSLWGGRKRSTVAYVWNNIPAISSTADRAINLLMSGYKVVVATATHLYFDMKYEDLPEERGTDWASKSTSTYDVFTYKPMNIIQREKRMKFNSRKTNSKAIPVENIIGMQAHLWTEMVHNPDEMFYMLFPRLLAVAERAWHKAPWEDSKFNAPPNYIKNDWTKFATTVASKELKRLDELDIKYRVPSLGILRENGLLKANSEFPGLPIQYSTDNGRTWTELDHKHGTKVNGEPILIRVLTADRRRNSQQMSTGNSFHIISLYAYIFFISGISLMLYFL